MPAGGYRTESDGGEANSSRTREARRYLMRHGRVLTATRRACRGRGSTLVPRRQPELSRGETPKGRRPWAFGLLHFFVGDQREQQSLKCTPLKPRRSLQQRRAPEPTPKTKSPAFARPFHQSCAAETLIT